jgi:hypothetical protein
MKGSLPEDSLSDRIGGLDVLWSQRPAGEDPLDEGALKEPHPGFFT